MRSKLKSSLSFRNQLIFNLFTIKGLGPFIVADQ